MRNRRNHVHRDTAREAGFGTVSPVSVLAGVLAAYGAFAIVAAVVGSILSALDVETEFRTDDWTGSGAVAALASALVLLAAYLFGGYVAGRMARRAGVLHGGAVFLASLVLGAVVGGVVGALAEGDRVEENLRSIGVPTTTDQISDVAIAGVVLSLLAVLVGSIVGSVLGERWHTKLARRAADPDIGPAAELRDQAARADEERDRRIGRDAVVDQEAQVQAREEQDPPDEENR